MYRLKRVRLPIAITLLALSLLVAACGPSANGTGDTGAGNKGAAARLNQQGNEAFADGTYDQALVSYQEAQEKAPELAEPYYNGSNALYRQGAYPEAGEQMKQALNQAESESLAQGGHYNLGNVSYQSKDWEAAVQAYKQALLLDPDDRDAKYNLELALQQLQQQEQEQQQQQQQQQQEQDQEQNKGDGEQDPQDPQDQQDQQDQNSEGSENSQDEQEQEQNQDRQGSEGQPENERDAQGDPQPQPGQRMTSEQARQLLAAIAQDAETLQERLGQIFRVPDRPSAQDW